jgi:hypothetical protein
MQSRKRPSKRAFLLAVPLVWSALTVAEAVATANDGGQADAGADSGVDGGATSTDGRDHLCSVAGSSGAFGTALGAGCC